MQAINNINLNSLVDTVVSLTAAFIPVSYTHLRAHET